MTSAVILDRCNAVAGEQVPDALLSLGVLAPVNAGMTRTRIRQDKPSIGSRISCSTLQLTGIRRPCSMDLDLGTAFSGETPSAAIVIAATQMPLASLPSINVRFPPIDGVG